MPVTEVMGVRETRNSPPLTGGGLCEGEELGPEQKKRLRGEISDEKRLREGITVHNAHGCPSWLSRRT